MPAWTAPRTWVAANTLTAAQLNTDVRDNTLHLYEAFGTWTAFTPTLGGTSAALGNGTLVCHYMQINKTVHARYILLGGSTTNLSSDRLTLTLPVTARDPGNYRVPVGVGHVFDSGVASYHCIAIIDHATDTANDRIFFAYGGTTLANVNDATPIANFGASDTLSATITYEAA
ncbi:MAG: hypothetical protein ACO35E_09310 [Ilumatobacteraceae bacterium]